MDGSEPRRNEPLTLRQCGIVCTKAIWRLSGKVTVVVAEMIFYSTSVRRLAFGDLRSGWRSGRHVAKKGQERRELRKALRPHFQRLTTARIRQQVARASWLTVCLLLGMVAGFAAPSFMLAKSARSIPQGHPYVFVLWYVVMLVCTALAVRSMRQRNRIMLILMFYLLLAVGWVMLSHLPIAGNATSVLNAAAISSLAALLTVLVTAAPRFFAYQFAGEQGYLDAKLHPDTALVCEILGVCELVRAPDQLHFASDKKTIVDKLETAARIAETDLPRALKGRGHRINQAIDDRCKSIACGLREAQEWVLFPRKTTLHLLKRRLRKTLQNFASGEWATVPVGRVDSRRRLLRPLLSFVGRASTMLVAVAVFVVLAKSPGFQGLPLEVRSVVWLVIVSLVTLANPELKEHFNVRKLVVDLLASFKPKDR